MRLAFVAALAASVLVGCGSSSIAASGCAGVPTAKHTVHFLILFGQVSKLTRKLICSHYGRPDSIRALSNSRQVWTYGHEKLVLRGGRIVTVTSGKVPIGG